MKEMTKNAILENTVSHGDEWDSCQHCVKFV